MPLDPILRGLLEQLPEVPQGPLNFAEMRQQAEAMLPLFIGAAGVAPVASVEERTIAGFGGDVPVRIYRPKGAACGTLLYIHGGGWSVGNLAMTDPLARRLCQDLGIVVVTSSYRLAPEHPFPAAYLDALAAAAWVRDHAGTLGGAGRPLVIAGDSAGGNLTAAVCIGLRDADDLATGLSQQGRPRAAFDLQLLLYPATDLRPSSWAFPSRQADADPTLRTSSVRELFETYAGTNDPADWRLSPLAAEDLAGLPPAMIVVLQVDPLRDEALAFSERLEAAGVDVAVIEFDNLTHGFAHMSAIVPAAGNALHAVLARLKTMLTAQSRP